MDALHLNIRNTANHTVIIYYKNSKRVFHAATYFRLALYWYFWRVG